MGRVAPVVTEPDPGNFPAQTSRKNLGIEPVPDVGRLDVGREVLDEEAGLDDETDFRRVDVALAAGRVRSDGVRLLSEPGLDVDDRPGSNHDHRVALVRADHHVGEVVHVHVDAAAERVSESPDVLEREVLGGNDLIRKFQHLGFRSQVDEDLSPAVVGSPDDDVGQAVVVEVAGVGNRETEPRRNRPRFESRWSSVVMFLTLQVGTLRLKNFLSFNKNLSALASWLEWLIADPENMDLIPSLSKRFFSVDIRVGENKEETAKLKLYRVLTLR